MKSILPFLMILRKFHIRTIWLNLFEMKTFVLFIHSTLGNVLSIPKLKSYDTIRFREMLYSQRLCRRLVLV